MALFRMAASGSDASPDAREHMRLWDAHARAIYRYCFRRTADVAVAEDLTSIVFLEAWRRRRELSVAPEEMLPWLYGVAINVLRNQRRSQRRYESALARLPRPMDEPDFADTVTDRLDDERRMSLILGRLRKLSRVEQEVLSLCVWEGLSPQEAAAALAVPEATVRTRLHRARRRLRTLEEEDADAAPASTPAATQGEHP